MNNKIIVDTCVWIEYFKGGFAQEELIERGLSLGYIYVVGPIISELLQGAKTQKEYNMLKRCIDAIPFIDFEYQDWINAGQIASELRKNGITVPLTDVIISAAAIKNNAKIFTFDKHFKKISKVELL
jgi:predicted nucleic acid-binding protein